MGSKTGSLGIKEKPAISKTVCRFRKSLPLLKKFATLPSKKLPSGRGMVQWLDGQIEVRFYDTQSETPCYMETGIEIESGYFVQ